MRIFLVFISLSVFLFNCAKEDHCDENTLYYPTPVDLNSKLPSYLNRMVIPIDNETTEEGIAFGRILFFEPLLSADGTQSCGSCHLQSSNFTDPRRFSVGIDGIKGDRNAMHLANPGMGEFFFWDGRANSLEEQAFGPVTNPIEMHDTWPNVENKLNNIEAYQTMNFEAFGTYEIDSVSVVKAIAQFERSLISNNSKFDRFMADSLMFPLSEEEARGRILFFSDRETDINGNVTQSGADCFHCHIPSFDFTDNFFHNNGLDMVPKDSGRAKVTKEYFDVGAFKTPSLRNVAYTAPYMHDGRFANLDSVINFYSEGVQDNELVDDKMKNAGIGGVRLSANEKADLKAFLMTLSDPDFINNPAHSDPNKAARRQP